MNVYNNADHSTANLDNVGTELHESEAHHLAQPKFDVIDGLRRELARIQEELDSAATTEK